MAGGVGGVGGGGGGGKTNGGGGVGSGKGVGGGNKTNGGCPPGGGLSAKGVGAGLNSPGPSNKPGAPSKPGVANANIAAKAGIDRAPMTKAALNAKFDAKAKTAPGINPAAPGTKAKAAKTASVLSPRSLKNLNNVNPKVAGKIKAAAADLAKKGIKIAVTDGFRTKAQQRALYAQGRQPLSQVNALRKAAGMGPINAKANRKTVTSTMNSLHRKGLAVDVAPVENGRITWDPKKPGTWNAIGAAGKKQGLEWGGDWNKPDMPHFQLKNP